jgi:hypothetical protein
MEWVASTLHTTSEHGVSNITTADAHTSAASSRLNWRPRRFEWTRPFRRKTKSGFNACAITFQTQSTTNTVEDGPNHSPCSSSFLFRFLFFVFPFFLSFFVSYISGFSAAVLDTDSTVKYGFTSPVMTSYITRLHSSDPFWRSLYRASLMYSFKYNQQDAKLCNVLYCCQCSTCFRRFFRPSSGAQTVHSIWYMSSLLAATASVGDLAVPTHTQQ